MKKPYFKKIFSCLAACFITFYCAPKCSCEGIADKFFGVLESINPCKSNSQSSESVSANEETNKDEFNFIKSGENENNFIYNGNWLLYGGILLIIMSITGMILTFKKPKKYRKRRRK